MLEVNNVTKIYPNGSGIKNLSLVIKDYGVYGVLGVNGAGKSTLFNVITGYISCGTNLNVPNGKYKLVPRLIKKI